MNAFSSVLLFLSNHPWLFALAKGSLMLVVTALVFTCACQLRLSAAARHGVLLAGCAVALVVPLLAMAEMQGWRLQMADAPVEVKQPVLPTSTELMRIAAEPMGAPTVTTIVDSQPVEIKSSAGVGVSAQSASPAWHSRLTGVHMACLLWLLGVVTVLAPLAVAYARLFWQTLRSRPMACVLWQRVLIQSAARAGVRHRVRLCVLPQASLTPATFGVGRFTCVAVPESALDWPEEEIRLVLDHELAHVRRHDWLARLVGQLVLAVYWFHPLAWWATQRMGVEAEFACDDRVVAGGVSAPAYAECMLEMAKRMARGNRSGWMAPAMPFAAALPARIARVLESSHPRHRLAKAWGLGLVLGASLAVGAIGCVRMERKPPDPVVVAALIQAKKKELQGQMLAAAAMGRSVVVQRLLDAGVKVDMQDENGWQPLHWVAKGGRTEAAKVLIAAGAKASARLAGGETPASLADEGNHRELSVYLMERAAEDYSPMAMQMTLVNAARNGDAVSIRRLLAVGANANNQGALQHAILQGHADVVSLLIKAGAQVNTPDQDGDQPLHWATMNNNMEVPGLLIAAGADVLAKDAKGKTPALLAKEKGHSQLAAYFTQEAAKQAK